MMEFANSGPMYTVVAQEVLDNTLHTQVSESMITTIGQEPALVRVDQPVVSTEEEPVSKEALHAVLKDVEPSKPSGKKKPNKSKIFICEHCSFHARTRYALKEHMKSHSNVKPYKCPHCDYCCYRERNLKIHEFTHQKKKPVQCPFCDYTCIQKFQLRAHLLLHESETPFVCQTCGATYKKEAGLKTHMLTHSNTYKFSCKDCQYKTNRFADYRRHVLIHSTSRPVKCSLCSYTCIRESRLRAHMLVHRKKEQNSSGDPILADLDQKLLRCSMCDYVCVLPSRMKKHMGSHTGISPYSCNLCKFTCNKASTLKTHKLKHKAMSISDHQTEANQPGPSAAPLRPDQTSVFNTSQGTQITIQINSTQDFGSTIGTLNQQDLWDTAEGAAWTEENFAASDYNTFDQTVITNVQPAKPNFLDSLIAVVKQEQVEEDPKVPRNHSTSKMFHCEQCDFSCDYVSTFNKHKLKHSTTKNFKCAHCDYMCNDLGRMKDHLLVHTTERAFGCELCSYTCKRAAGLKTHMKVHTRTEGELFRCNTCEYTCKSAQGLKAHMMKHVGARPYQCRLCQASFETQYRLKKHQFDHGLKPYQCEHCTYSSVTLQQMKIHRLQHTAEYPFCCSMCNAKYKKEDSLNIHIMSVHKQMHKYTCGLCNYAGNRAADFREHMLTHSDKKPHQCPHCAYSCIRRAGLKKHIQIHLKGKEPSVVKKKFYRCAFCDFKCSRTGRLKAHLSKIHLDLPENISFSIEMSQLQSI